MGLGLGILLGVLWRWRVFPEAWIGHVVGWPLILFGLAVTTWAVVAAAGADLKRPGHLVVTGPYCRSRNPMYLAWTALYIGFALVLNTVWPLLLLPVVVLLTDLTIRHEERTLEATFGDAYRAYRSRVRRYL